ncbi:hypothetical protein PQR75_10010 [Paraburkholderia fungorum]|uniref:hypothetical protein n=1 Tax=Paraburkholderia fungorum TaxID=134537 RepID=UPI0038BBBA10
MHELEAFTYFHDWHIDVMAVTNGGHDLTLSLFFKDRRATVTFAGTSRCVVEHFGLVNIVYDITILEPGTSSHDTALKKLQCSDCFLKSQANQLALVASSAGVEIVVEFAALRIESV